jgi:cytochrome c-type biogenesis protein CcmH
VLLWVILACLTAIVLLVLLRPLAGSGVAEPGREAFDAAVYRDQLGEVDSDRARGLIGEAEAEAARLEIARRLLAADSKARGQKGERKGGIAPRTALVAVALMLPLTALGLYLVFGSPRLPDQPLTARLEDPANDRNPAVLVARVEARLREHPDEGQGWDVIAPVYMSMGRYSDAADAYGNAIRLLGPSAKRLSGEGQAMVLENGGVVTEDARHLLTRALELDSTLMEPRILIAIAKEQDGKFAEAIDDWRALLAKTDNANWREMVKKRIAVAEAHLAGKPVGEAEGSPSSKMGSQGGQGPSAADVAAAQTMSPADREAMVERMVQRLATRLEQQGDDLAGWLKLVRAYTVLDRKDDALKALARAKSQFAGNAQAIQQLDALAAQLGLKS